MTEDDGYETIVPATAELKDLASIYRDSLDPIERLSPSEIWDAAYNQALKDAAETAATVIVQARCGDIDNDLRCVGHHLESRILSLGDKGNG